MAPLQKKGEGELPSPFFNALKYAHRPLGTETRPAVSSSLSSFSRPPRLYLISLAVVHTLFRSMPNNESMEINFRCVEVIRARKSRGLTRRKKAGSPVSRSVARTNCGRTLLEHTHPQYGRKEETWWGERKAKHVYSAH